MKAIELFDLAINAINSIKHGDKKYPYLYYFANRTFDIHKVGDANHWIVFSYHGTNITFWKESTAESINPRDIIHRNVPLPIVRSTLEKFDGDDWEFYSSVRHFHSGYIPNYDQLINKLYDKKLSDNIPDSALIVESSFLYVNGFEIEFLSIPELIKRNMNRNVYHMRNLPFDKSRTDDIYFATTKMISHDPAIYPYFDESKEAIDELFRLISEIEGIAVSDIDYKVYRLNKPVYCA